MQPVRIETSHNGYVISTDAARVEIDAVHDFLSNEGYWSLGRSRELVQRSIENSGLVCAAYAPDNSLAGFARMVTDFATFAYLCDVFVLARHRGAGLGVAIVTCIVEHPDVATLKRQMLATLDAHELYTKLGFTALDEPARWMEKRATPLG